MHQGDRVTVNIVSTDGPGRVACKKRQRDLESVSFRLKRRRTDEPAVCSGAYILAKTLPMIRIMGSVLLQRNALLWTLRGLPQASIYSAY
jgi:hypothetical protein